jgi:hypothetical protein
MPIKVGDRVRVKGAEGMFLNLNGLEGEVRYRYDLPDCWIVEFPGGDSPMKKRATLTESVLYVVRPEAACANPTCGKLNDVGVARCWNCGVSIGS